MTDREKLKQSMTELYNKLLSSPFPKGSISCYEGEYFINDKGKVEPFLWGFGFSDKKETEG